MKYNMIFPQEEADYSTLTAKATLPEGEVLHVKTVGLSEGDSIMIEEAIHVDDCETIWRPVKWLGNPCCCCEDGSVKTISYSYPTTDFLIPMPGEYRFLLTNEDGLHETDPGHFEDVRVFYTRHKASPLMEKFIQFNC